MRAVLVHVVLAAALGWAGCNTDASIGRRIRGASVVAGGSCTQGSDCVSGLCLGQNCCTLASCGTDPTCQGASCDSTGACAHPAVVCGTPNCDATTNQLTTSACSQGACVAGTPAACPGHLTCADPTSCRGSCSLSADCTAGFYCSNGSCLAQLPAGIACASNDSCTSAICGASGNGHCCTAACATSDRNGCGASDCDTTGACAYPPAATPCVSQSCTGHVLTEPASCDGVGVCAIPSPATLGCDPYACGTTGTCRTTCASNGDCWNGFCHLATQVCCPAYAGNQIEVDGTQGVDKACCGGAVGPGACATIAFAVGLVGETQLSGITVHVANPPNGTDWTADAFPIRLSYGLILNAPGVAFSDPGADQATFLVQQFGAETATSAVVEGSAAQPILIGMDSKGRLTSAIVGLRVDSPMTLFLLNVIVHDPLYDAKNDPYPYDTCLSAAPELPCYAGIRVGPGATLTLGTDGQGSSGIVAIGGTKGGPQETTGIWCVGLNSVGGHAPVAAIVNDIGSSANPSVWIQDHFLGLASVDQCSVSLTASPRFGSALNAQGQCDLGPDSFTGQGLWQAPFDTFEIYLGGSYWNAASPVSSATLSNAILECAELGVFVDADDNNTASFLGDSDLIQHNVEGVHVVDNFGVFKPTNTILSHNRAGLVVGSSGIDLVQGASGVDLSAGGNQVTCNGDSAEDPDGVSSIWLYPLTYSGGVGAGVLMLSAVSVDMSNTSWNHWDGDAGHTEVWVCPYFTDCTCSESSTCPPAPSDGGGLALPSGADVVWTLYPDSGVVNDSNGSAAANGCP